MNRNKTLKPCNYFARLLFYGSVRFLRPSTSKLIPIFLLGILFSQAQNKLQKIVSADQIETISINGNQIFNISVSTVKTDEIKVTSILDGEYQNDFQILLKKNNNTIQLSLEHMSFTDIPDDKRNAHKVIAAMLYLEIPEKLSLHIISDIGFVNINGSFKSIVVELSQGECRVKGEAEIATINTLEGDIDIVTKNARIEANSNNGTVSIDKFTGSKSLWNLKTINGDITVTKQE
ncbi:hypothetical protein [uncultured Winogradskyella sp.]|uniref:hypothetical protein n=1 Tax=uncultured Winogradskyella sp. TaxID=395353 RepID=UPI0026143371|nr:hypothetical protein [uncultured Winogradskyella sp.]